MVSPSLQLHRKIRNTRTLTKQNESVQQFHEKEPHNYLDSKTYIKIEELKPWIENHKKTPETKRTTHKQIPTSTSTLIPNSLYKTIHDNILIICVDFLDKPSQIPTQTIYNRFFTSPKSLKSYYNENSYGTHIIEGRVYGWYRAPNLYSYYVNNENGLGLYPNNSQKLVEDVINIIAYDPTIDFTYIDNDNDNTIDYLIIVHSGGEAAYTGSLADMWAHVWNINPTLKNGYGYEYYAIVSEFISNPSDIQRSGVDCHEFGHLIGLPDLYDYSDNSYGVGLYSLMSHGSWGTDSGITPLHLDAWSKYNLGYTNTIINQTGNVILNNSELNNTNYLYTTQYPNEYFIIENRQKISFDVNIPSVGALIWKINELKITNNNELCFKVALLQSDGLRNLENSINYGDNTDSYPGLLNKTLFSKSSHPSSILCDGNYPSPNFELSLITLTNDVITFYAAITTCNPIICSLQIT